MPTPVKALRDAIYTAILAKKMANGFTINGFDLGKKYQPFTRLEELNPAGQVWVVPMTGDELSESRSNIYSAEYPVQIALQVACDPDADATIDQYVDLEQELRDTCRNLTGYQWKRNEALRDPNGTPYSYSGLREQGVLLIYFHAYYQFTVQ